MDNLVPIGRFSKMTRLSIKALRLYDELGLLAPAMVDPASGYRYYHPGQANRAEAIRILRQVDMPLEEIAEVLAEQEPSLAAKRLAMHRDRLADRLAHQERMLRFLERLIDREGSIMPYDVTIETAPAVTVAAVRKHTNLARVGATLAEAFGEAAGAVSRSGAQFAGPPFVIYHDVIDEQTEGDIEACIPVAGSFAGSDSVRCETLPETRVAATMHHGPYPEIAPAYHTLSGWIQEHGHQMAGAPREVYLNDPETTAPEDLLTQVQWPIESDG
jgi:effector-binding domain-containing protein